jgi:integrase
MAISIIFPLTFTNLKPSDKDQLISDGGSLFVSVRSITNGGSKSFRMAYRINGKQKWITLKALTLSTARIERDKHKELIKQGKDPSLERMLQIERAKQQQLDEQATLTKLKARMVINDLFVRWCDTDLTKRKDLKEIIRLFSKDVLPEIGCLFVEDVRKGHISLIIGELKQRGAEQLARNLLKLIRQMFRFAVTYDLIEFDPTASLSIAKMTTKATERDRVLSEPEIRALSRQLPDANLMPSTERAVWIALATLCRIGELSKAKRTDIDLVASTWVIPKENSKNKKAHTIYLSNFALDQFKALLSVSTSAVWLFPHKDDTRFVSTKALTNQIGGRQLGLVGASRFKDNQALVLSGGKWTPHDLRRTGATLMGDLGVAPDVIEKCLNHTEENKVKRIYQRQKLEAEQAQAWQLLGDRLRLLINLDANNVITLHQKH